ncbi:LytR/AlgR family response regulator transcription factor [Cetobacterium sp. SF1]|uniref:LytR/AlgR family response regulator transcription factor n=1 Tax=Cetobacterium sp. SF1 TaxID=3417654 RepID=UPI003CED5D29
MNRFYYMGNKTFLFLLSEVLEENIQDISSGNIEIDGENNILILEDLEKIEEIEKYRDKLKMTLCYADILKTKYLNFSLEKSLNIRFYEKNQYIDINNIINEMKKIKLNFEDKILVSDFSEEVLINLNKIDYFSYDRNNKKAFLKFKDQKIFLRKTLSELEDILPEEYFFRIERSYIVNINQIIHINYKEEYIIFESLEKIYVNKLKLKNLSQVLEQKYKTI